MRKRRASDVALIELLKNRIQERRMEEGVKQMQLIARAVGAPDSLLQLQAQGSGTTEEGGSEGKM